MAKSKTAFVKHGAKRDATRLMVGDAVCVSDRKTACDPHGDPEWLIELKLYSPALVENFMRPILANRGDLKVR